MLFLVHLQHEFVVMKLPLAYGVPQAIEELVHDESLPTARVTPEVDGFQFRQVKVLIFL